MDFSRTYGIHTDQRQLRALSPEEIEAYELANVWAKQQAVIPPYQYMAMRNHVFARPAPPEKPLDERFADFKKRLAITLEKRKSSGLTPDR